MPEDAAALPILLVEDDLFVREALTDVLVGDGYDAVVVANRGAALDRRLQARRARR